MKKDLEENKENPAVKIGDSIILIKNNNGSDGYTGLVLKVLSLQGKNFTVKTDKGTCVIFNTNPRDNYILADNKLQILHYKSKLESLKLDIDEINKKISHLEKYETEEDFVADKLDMILTAHASSTSKKTRVNSIKDILSTLKDSNLI